MSSLRDHDITVPINTGEAGKRYRCAINFGLDDGSPPIYGADLFGSPEFLSDIVGQVALRFAEVADDAR